MINQDKEEFGWELWFAWYPVKAESANGEDERWVWGRLVWWTRVGLMGNYYVIPEDDDDDDYGTPLTSKLGVATI